MTNIICLSVACVLGGYLIGILIGSKRAFKAEERADRYLFAILDVDRWCGHPFPAARIIAKHLKAIGEGYQLNAGTPCGEEPCTVMGLREQLRRLESADLAAAARDVLAERRRQKEAEGWTPEHDDAHEPMAIALAGASYVLSAAGRGSLNGCPSILWPWSPQWWKPSSPRRDLVKAGALIQAEIERLDRAALSGKGV